MSDNIQIRGDLPEGECLLRKGHHGHRWAYVASEGGGHMIEPLDMANPVDEPCGYKEWWCNGWSDMEQLERDKVVLTEEIERLQTRVRIGDEALREKENRLLDAKVFASSRAIVARSRGLDPTEWTDLLLVLGSDERSGS